MLRWEPGQGAGSGARQAGAHGFVWLQLRVAPRLLVPSAVVPPHCKCKNLTVNAKICLIICQAKYNYEKSTSVILVI